MTVKLFIIGLPGSGKSTVARHISNYARNRQWSTIHFNDYDILYQMSKEDTQGQFKKAHEKYDGFDVVDFAAFDTALRKLEQRVNAHISAVHFEEIVLIEFSRNDYEHAFHQFNQEFIQHAYFLYLNVDVEICKKRIRERITHPGTLYDYYVSEYIFEKYYTGDDGERLPEILAENFGIDRDKVEIIYNGGLQQDFSTSTDKFVDSVISLEAHHIRNTEPIQEVKGVEVKCGLEQNEETF